MRPGITSTSPSIVVVIAALHYIMCSMSRDNDGAREDCGANSAWRCRCLHKSYSLPHSMYVCVCGKLCGLTGSFAAQDEFLPRVMTSYSVASDGHAHKVPVWRVERAGGGDGCEDIRWDRCARPSAVRVTGGPCSFSVYHFSDRGTTRNANGSRPNGKSLRPLKVRGVSLSLPHLA